MSGFDIGKIRPVSGSSPQPASTPGRALQIFNPAKLQLTVHVQAARHTSGGALANVGARLATGFFSVTGAALTAGGLAAMGATPGAVALSVALFGANYVTKLVFSKPLVAVGALIAGERPGEVIKQVFN